MCNFISTTIYPSFTIDEVMSVSSTLVLTNRGTQFWSLWRDVCGNAQNVGVNKPLAIKGCGLRVSPWNH